MPRFGRSYPMMNTLPRQNLVPIVFDALGAGTTGSKSGTATWSQTHVIGVQANSIFAFFQVWSTSTPSACTATCGGVNMIQIKFSAAIFSVSSDPCSIALFGLLNPPTGSQSVAVTLTGGGTTEDGFQDSVSYRNVSGWGVPVTNTATSTSMTVGPIPVELGGLALCMFVPGATSTSTISAFSGTTRKNQAWSSGVNFTALIGDEAKTGPVTLTATNSASDPYGAVALPLLH
jgi:hypothetical protein